MSTRGALVRAVLDTNVLYRGLSSGRGPSGRILDALMDGAFVLVTSEAILDELGDVLRRPRIRKRVGFAEAEIVTTIGAFRRIARTVPGAYVVEMVPTDPKDDKIVAAGLEGGADYLVTEDQRDLLPLKVTIVAGHKPLQVVTARHFLREVLSGSTWPPPT